MYSVSNRFRLFARGVKFALKKTLSIRDLDWKDRLDSLARLIDRFRPGVVPFHENRNQRRTRVVNRGDESAKSEKRRAGFDRANKRLSTLPVSIILTVRYRGLRNRIVRSSRVMIACDTTYVHQRSPRVIPTKITILPGWSWTKASSDRREFMDRIDVLERREGDTDKTWSSLDRTRFHVLSFVRSSKSGTIDLIARSRQNRVG